MKNQNDRGMKSKIVPMAVLGGIVLLSVGCGLASCSWSPSVLAVNAESVSWDTAEVYNLSGGDFSSTSNVSYHYEYGNNVGLKLPTSSNQETYALFYVTYSGTQNTFNVAYWNAPTGSVFDIPLPSKSVKLMSFEVSYADTSLYNVRFVSFGSCTYSFVLMDGVADISFNTYNSGSSWSKAALEDLIVLDGFEVAYSYYDSTVVDDAYGNGYEQGKKDGYAYGYGQGKADGTASGQESGYASGYSQGVADGYQQGYSVGYQESGSFLSQLGGLIGNVVMLPVNVIMSVLDFNVLGVNISSVVKSLITIVLVLFIIRLIFNMPVKIENGAKPSDSEVTHHVESRTSQLNSKGELQGTISHYSHETTSKRHGK